MRALLGDDEALLSFYFGENASFVWAVAKDKPVTFPRPVDHAGRTRREGRASCARRWSPKPRR